MRSISLIAPNKNEISCLYQQWKDRAENVFMDHEHGRIILSDEIKGEAILEFIQ